MNMQEYEQVKNYSYEEYVKYLQKKYGLAPKNYMSRAGGKNLYKNSRTTEGLVIHHKYEDRALTLCHKSALKFYPYEYQFPENLVYCDYLEHLLLHVLIYENDKSLNGAIAFIVPELNDVYSGWITKEPWRQMCHKMIINDKSVYIAMIKRLIAKDARPRDLFRCFNKKYGLWAGYKNKSIYLEIANCFSDEWGLNE